MNTFFMHALSAMRNKGYKLFCFLLCVILSTNLSAQKVGLVMSGGGAKGCFHIGVIQALEENHIPIDYVAGTSMGAIIAGLYAMGYTPQEMLTLILSDEFRAWQTGEVSASEQSNYKMEERPTQALQLKIGLKNSSTQLMIPSSLINPIQMNFAFMKLFAQSSAACGEDFDQLMVPFRCIASDIYDKKAIVLRNGDLGNAIRASMSFPFVFKPISIDNTILFDGGMYNNFPVDVMEADFQPDFIIGSVVAHNTTKDETSPFDQLSAMTMQNTDYSVPADKGVLIDVHLPDVSLLDFYKAKELADSGYRMTMARIAEIKQRVTREVAPESVTAARKAFQQKFPPLEFRNFIVEGINEQQKQYFARDFKLLREEGSHTISMEAARTLYFTILSDPTVAEILPRAHYNSTTQQYDLIFNIKLQPEITLMAGFEINSASSGHPYVGAIYHHLSHFKQTYTVDAIFGQNFNMVRGDVRFDFASYVPFFVRITGAFDDEHYYKKDNILNHTASHEILYRQERYAKLSIGTPLSDKGKLELGLGHGLLSDEYYQSDFISTFFEWEQSEYRLTSIFLRAERNTLNMLPYPTQGFKFETQLKYLTGHEQYKAGNLKYDYESINTEIFGSTPIQNEASRHARDWFQFSFVFENYFETTPNFLLGTLFQGTLSNQEIMDNYMATVISAPRFSPTPHSRTLFNPAFTAHQFVAGGVMPTWKMTKNFALRTDLYAFLPFNHFVKTMTRSTSDYIGTAYRTSYGHSFSSMEYMAETSLIFNLESFQFSVFANYYSKNDYSSLWNFGINIGYLLKNIRFVD